MFDTENIVELFFDKTYEAYITEKMLYYDYAFPQGEMEDYVLSLISTPYQEFIDYVCQHYCPREITSSDIPQISNYESCTQEVTKILCEKQDPGLDCLNIGISLFNDGVERKDGAYIKFGENHVKGAEFHGLTYSLDNKWFLTCLGRVFPTLDSECQQYLSARTLLRNPFFHIVVSEACKRNVNICNYMGSLSLATQKRRSSSCLQFFNVIINQCEKENVDICSIFLLVMIKIKKSILAINN